MSWNGSLDLYDARGESFGCRRGEMVGESIGVDCGEGKMGLRIRMGVMASLESLGRFHE